MSPTGKNQRKSATAQTLAQAGYQNRTTSMLNTKPNGDQEDVAGLSPVKEITQPISKENSEAVRCDTTYLNVIEVLRDRTTTGVSAQ